MEICVWDRRLKNKKILKNNKSQWKVPNITEKQLCVCVCGPGIYTLWGPNVYSKYQ